MRVLGRRRRGRRRRLRHGRGRTPLSRHAAAHQQTLNRFLVVAEVARIADANRETIASFHGLRDGSAAERDFDGILNVADPDAVAGRLLAVDLNLQIALALYRLGANVAGPFHALVFAVPLERQDDLLTYRVDGVHIRAE